VSSSTDETLRIWDVTTGCEIVRLEEVDIITSAIFLPDDTRVIFGLCDGAVYIWANNPSLEPQFLCKFQAPKRHHGYNCQAQFSFSHDGRQIASVCADNKSIEIWDIQAQKRSATCHGHTDVIHKTDFSRNGLHLVSCSKDRTVRIWDTYTGQQIKNLQGHSDAVLSVTFSPENSPRYIASSSEDNTIRLWSAAEQSQQVHLSTVDMGEYSSSTTVSVSAVTFSLGV
jgi:WD40 repeat protein